MANSFILTHQTIPESLRHIPQPPQQIYVLSDNWQDLLQRPAVAIVGSRNPTSYGRSVTQKLAADLASQGVVIVSGLAYGIDELAHRAALEAGGLTIAVMATGLDKIYPAANKSLAEEIVGQGGALISEYDPAGKNPQPYQFVERNRLIAGLSRIVIVPEAGPKSGSRHTIDFAIEQGKDVMAVPGPINGQLSAGPNLYIRDGAGVILNSHDVFRALGIGYQPIQKRRPQLNPAEATILNLVDKGVSQGNELFKMSNLPSNIFSQTMTMLELAGQIRNVGNNHWAPP